jgi:uncharacterized protein (TIGR02646 family)
MKHLIKTVIKAPNYLQVQEGIGIPQTSSESKARWKGFRSADKRIVREDILQQQFNLCGYTEFDIDEFKSLINSTFSGCHLEHIKPKSIFPRDTFNANNLIVSIIDSQELKKVKEGVLDGDTNSFGGDHKDNFFCEIKFISPLNAECWKYFKFIESSGEIVPSNELEEPDDAKKAQYTIDLLNLNHSFLKNQRKKRMREVAEEIDEIECKNQLQKIKLFELSLHDGKYFSFPSAVASVF